MAQQQQQQNVTRIEYLHRQVDIVACKHAVLECVLMGPRAKLPVLGSKHAAGVDLFSSNADTIRVPPGEMAVVPTDVSVLFPFGYFGQLANRSSLGKMGILLHGGVIDQDYRGALDVIVYNISKNVFVIEPGMKIAQLLVIRHLQVGEIRAVLGHPFASERDAKGFGSSGLY